MQAVAEAFDLPGPVLELGSLQVDHSELIDLRKLFPGREYTGVDFRPGPGVDCVADAEALPQATGSIGTVLSLSVFEHVKRFWVAFDEVHRVLRPDGVFVCAVPFHFHVHAYPSDYWRFTPEAVDLLMERYPTRLLGWHGAARRMTCVWAVGFREEARLPTEAQLARYRELMAAYAKEPLKWGRRMRYKVGQVLCGRRPFAPYLDRENWTLEIRGHPLPGAGKIG
jgi:SAM-dependent methyltransferase